MQQISLLTRCVVVISCLLILVSNLSAQRQIRDLPITLYGNPYPGYWVVNPNTTDTVTFVDNSGKPAFKIGLGPHVNPTVYRDRYISVFAGDTSYSGFVRLDQDFNRFDTVVPVGPYSPDFHEGYATSDTSFILLSVEKKKIDMSKLTPNGQPDAEIWGNVIQELTYFGKVLFEWHSLDHFSWQDATSDIDLSQPVIESIHINSILRDSDGNFLVSCRHLDEVIKINASTGAVMWRLGGSKSKSNQFRFLNDTVNGFVGFSHQHRAIRTAAGTILLYDNGNLKSEPRSSRFVEYEVDETAKTARKIWEYEPNPKVYSSTMGSVVELPSGGRILGYGSPIGLDGSFITPVAEELGPNGAVVARIMNLPSPRINAYRVSKTTFGMTGYRKVISAKGLIDFSSGDSTTLFTVRVDTLLSETALTIERHHYKPHSFATNAGAYCGVPPARWVVRADDIARVRGTITVNVSTVRDVEDPAGVTWFYRPTEGTGTFEKINVTYSAATKLWTIPTIRQGEYTVAYKDCLHPNLVSPANESTGVPQAPTLTWTSALFATSYEVQVSRDSSFKFVDTSAILSATSFTTSILRNNTTFWWRVRKLSAKGPGNWSSVWKFRTEFNRPIIVTPKTAAPLVMVDSATTFRWSAVPGALLYQIKIFTDTTAVVDSVLRATTFHLGTMLPYNALLGWTVRAVIDGVEGGFSDTNTFATVIQAPILLSPEPNDALSPRPRVTFRWEPVPGAAGYTFTLRSSIDTAILHSEYVSGAEIETPVTAQSAPFVWTCRTRSSYGPGLASSGSFSIAESVGLTRPVIGSDVERVRVPAMKPLTCSWLPSDGATLYRIQFARNVRFHDLLLDTLIPATSQTIQLSPNVVGAWRVRAMNVSSISPWSDTVYVSSVVDSTVTLLPLTPIHGATGVTEEGVFTYTNSPKLYRYEIDVARDPLFEQMEFKFYGFTNAVKYEALSPGNRYFWRVIGQTFTGEGFVGPTSTMVVGDLTGVSANDATGCSIAASRSAASSISLVISDGRNQQAHLRAFSVLGQEMWGGSVEFSSGRASLPNTTYTNSSYIIVTFSKDESYCVVIP